MMKDIHSISYKIIASALSGLMILTPATLSWAQANQQKPVTQDAAAGDQNDESPDWPRTYTDGNLDYTVYQPQIDSWSDDKIEARAAIAIKPAGATTPKYGVAWFSAKTLIDRQNDTVELTDVQVTKVSFPADTASEEQYAASLRKHVRTTIPDISLDSLQSALAVSEAEKGAKAVEIKNDPPHIYFSEKPAFLLRVDGKPVLRQIPGAKMRRVINTTSLLVFDEKTATYYLRAFKRWYQAKSLDSGAEPGEWTRVKQVPADLANVLKSAGPTVDALDTPPPDIAAAVNAGGDPIFYVATTPAELVQTAGAPELTPVAGTNLLYVKNTSSQLMLDNATQNYYLLTAGRWFKSADLHGGSWTFEPNDKLPADFAKIPETHPKGVVLSAVSGTPQAKQALIDNSIPQMAQVDRSKAKFTVKLDGAAQMKPIEGTSLQYVANAADPIILAGDGRYYAVANGVWFVSASLKGPWKVASSVPAEIYGIPTSSPLHYVTYVRIYGSSAKEVHVGYTPGYYGTAVSSSGVVVYGTGYAYDPWLAGTWYPAPATYGYGYGFGWGAATGFVFGAVVGAAWAGGAWGWRGWGWGNAPPRVSHYNQFNFNNANIYNRWQNNGVRSEFRNEAGNRLNNAGGRLSADQRQNLSNQNRNRADVGGQRQNQAGQARDRAGNQAGQGNRAKQGGQRQNQAGQGARAKQGAQQRPASRKGAQARPNNLYAGRDGNVYQRSGNGWQQAGGGGINRANPNIGRLDADRMARSRGNAMSGARYGGGGMSGMHGGGGFRGGGGGFRGGGGRGGRR